MFLHGTDTHGELRPFLSQEWLLTNGMGAFSSGTVVGCNTRRYHGLLCAAARPPLGRMLTLSRIGELVFLDGKTDKFEELSINQFGNTFHPRGETFLRRFSLGTTAQWEYEVEGVKIVKELQLVWGKNVAAVRYHIIPNGERQVELHLLPFVSMRDFHAVRNFQGRNFEVKRDTWRLAVSIDGHTLHLRADAGKFEHRSDWWYGHTYAVESERGLDDTEDLYVPGALVYSTRHESSVTIWAGLDDESMYEWAAELAKRPRIVLGYSPRTPESAEPSLALKRISRAAGDFVVGRNLPDGKPGTTIIAGYPWFGDWGRDTMIALPGLLLSTRRFEEAAQVLSVFADHISEGMIPNRFEDYTNEPSYNTVDASLWFIHACHEYLRLSADDSPMRGRLLDACRKIIEGYRKGTRYGIRMDEADGLINSGDEHTQLTWMDAKCNGIAFTPRHGKAVEINALWYNALKLMKEDELAGRVAVGFKKAFWISPFRGLADVVVNGKRDESIRPNQIFATSLPHSPLDLDQRRAVVEVVRRELLTPYGLRTLAKSDSRYAGRYFGPPMQRDRAYHNGTVWAWLIGAFLEGYINVHERSADALRQARVWLQPLVDSMNQGCIGQISECFEGDEPHRPVGAPAQAWSVAEVLRIAVEVGV